MTAVQPMPDGYPQVIPYLRDDGASAAINVQVVRAKERMRMPAPGGRIGHADAANTSKKIETIRIGGRLLLPSFRRRQGAGSGQTPNPR